jgi:hypothetical protein
LTRPQHKNTIVAFIAIGCIMWNKTSMSLSRRAAAKASRQHRHPSKCPPGYEQDFAAGERCQFAANSRAYATCGVLVPSGHHIGLFHEWATRQTDTHVGHA